MLYNVYLQIVCNMCVHASLCEVIINTLIQRMCEGDV